MCIVLDNLDMVGPRTIMKLKHCRDIRLKCLMSSAKVSAKGKKVKEISGSIRDFNIKRTRVESANDLCRVCLQEGTVPIFGNDTAKNIADDINTFGGIVIRINDPYPKNICMACLVLLESALLFRKTAQQSDKRIKQLRLFIKNEDEHSSNCSAINQEEDSSGIEQTVTVSGICEIIKKPIKVTDSEVNGYMQDFTCGNDSGSSNNTVTEQEMQVPNNINSAECTESYNCKKCNLKFNSFQEYSDHRLTDDHENKKDLCPICTKLYPPNYMKKHIAQHMQEALYVCDVCGKNFVLQSSFTRHRLTHFHDLPFKCSLCPYKGRFADALKMHMRSHTGERPYQCTECSAKFTSKSNLIKHAKIHKSQLDFSCDECPRGFYTKVELEQHIKVAHRGIKDNACRICNKTFAYRNQMMKHERKVHKREKLRSGKMPIYLQVQSVKDLDNVTHL